jgi:hypothetical protein
MLLERMLPIPSAYVLDLYSGRRATMASPAVSCAFFTRLDLSGGGKANLDGSCWAGSVCFGVVNQVIIGMSSRDSIVDGGY